MYSLISKPLWASDISDMKTSPSGGPLTGRTGCDSACLVQIAAPNGRPEAILGGVRAQDGLLVLLRGAESALGTWS